MGGDAQRRGDRTDRDLEKVRLAWPAVDTTPIQVVARLSYVLSHIYSQVEATVADFGLTRAGFEALAALRTAPPPHRLSQRALGEVLMRTSGTLSVRVDRLEREELVVREPDPHDARGVLVRLTPKGRRLIDRALPVRIETEARLLSALTADEQRQLIDLLRKLRAGFVDQEPGPRLGIAVARSRAAKELRRSLGLAEGVGLLVHAVDEDSIAARAGIAHGDLIVRAGRDQLRSTAQLRRSLATLAQRGELRLTLIRDGDEKDVTILRPR